MTGSDDLFDRARRVIPGGVHSPVRSFQSVGGTPLFIESAQGVELTDVDGRHYIDFCMAFGPMIFGHADPSIRESVVEALDRGWSFGAAETVSLELAELITANIRWIDSIRFVNSGTEAVMSAIRLARAATGRDKIVKFDGCYHGHADAMLIRAGSGLAGATTPDSAGVPLAVSQDTLGRGIWPTCEASKKSSTPMGRRSPRSSSSRCPPITDCCRRRPIFLRKLASLCHESRRLADFR